MFGVEVTGEVTITKLIPILELPEIICKLLNGIICQMDVDVSIRGLIFFGGHSKVTIFIEVSFLDTIDRSEDTKSSDVELSFVNEQRAVNVALDDEGSFLLISDFVLC